MIEPNDEVLRNALMNAYSTYDKFVQILNERDIPITWRYYPDGKAWLAKGITKWVGKRGGLKELTVFWLSIWNGFFKITIYIHEEYRNDIMKLSISDSLKDRIKNTHRMGNTFRTLPIVFNIDTMDEIDSILKIIDFRISKK